jgi:hypothetical protein
MNESSSASSSVQSPTLPLRSLQEIIHNRIIQKKKEMHPSHKSISRKSADRDRNIAMGLGSNTYASMTITGIIARWIGSNFFSLILS